LPAAVACCCLLPVPSNYLPLSWQMETKPTLLQNSERILNSCALLKIYSCNFNHTFMYRLDWWKNKLLLLLLLLLLPPQHGAKHHMLEIIRLRMPDGIPPPPPTPFSPTNNRL
jgi:hypothetical protein